AATPKLNGFGREPEQNKIGAPPDLRVGLPDPRSASRSPGRAPRSPVGLPIPGSGFPIPGVGLPIPGSGFPIPRVGFPDPEALTLRSRKFSDLNDDPCLHVRLTGNLAERLNP